MEKVKLSAVLADIEQPEQEGQLRIFSIRYVKTNGQRGEKLRVRKSGGIVQANGSAAATKPGPFRYHVKERGILLLVDTDTQKPFSLRIALITHYNGVRVWH